jgi:hypothetical protein
VLKEFRQLARRVFGDVDALASRDVDREHADGAGDAPTQSAQQIAARITALAGRDVANG